MVWAMIVGFLSFSPEFVIAMEAATATAIVKAARQPLIIAHRGNSSEAPENTLAAFESALKFNPDFIELDYHTTADGVPVVIHDKTLDRTTNALKLWGGEKLAVAGYRYDQIKDLDAGSWLNPRFAAECLPTLEQSLDLIQSGSMTMVEHKTGDAKTCVALLQRKKYQHQVVVQSFDWEFITDCHKLDNTILYGALGDKEMTEARLDQIAKTGAKIVGWNHKHVTQREIDMVHARGLKAWVYTVDEPARAKQLIAAGIDGIISNKPGTMVELRNQLRD